ncbi:MAG TPA: acetyl-CoA hydrolase/transferase C-terminal domain-containing protein [Gemmatimonadaceae bacterium]|nr:acetyl-CoA hydrolase/transferase C-terminal domain-containing protein [Gemmatimonadaceae bacterium]
MTDWTKRAVTPDEAVACVRSGMNIFVHGAAATPSILLEALARRRDLSDVTLYHMHTSGPAPFAEPEHQGRFLSISLFTGPPLRKAIEEGRADFMPIFLSDIPGLFSSGKVPLDVAILQLSPPDAHGYCTLGTSVDTALAASQAARYIVAEINDKMPRTHGNTIVPISRVHSFVHTNHPIHSADPPTPTPVEDAIGEHVAALVPDGATLQMGIGAIPDAALRRLFTKHDLGVHTEMLSDGIVDLTHAGVITNRLKTVHPGRTVTSFIMGSQRLYDFVHDNPLVEFHPCDRTNDTALIRKNPKVVAINSAIEVDLSGQICADSIGPRIFSGIGGQMDFIRGAALSPGGMPIIAIQSTAARGTVSRIVPTIKSGAGVVTTRGHVHWLVTEYGAVDLFGKSLRQRAELLISIAHPDFRAELRKQFAEMRHFVLSEAALQS